MAPCSRRRITSYNVCYTKLLRAEVVGVLAFFGPSFRLGTERIEAELIPMLQEAGGAISAGLGYLGDRITSYNVCYTKLLRASAATTSVLALNNGMATQVTPSPKPS